MPTLKMKDGVILTNPWGDDTWDAIVVCELLEAHREGERVEGKYRHYPRVGHAWVFPRIYLGLTLEFRLRNLDSLCFMVLRKIGKGVLVFKQFQRLEAACGYAAAHEAEFQREMPMRHFSKLGFARAIKAAKYKERNWLHYRLNAVDYGTSDMPRIVFPVNDHDRDEGLENIL